MIKPHFTHDELHFVTWRDENLILFVSGGGAAPNQHNLKFDGTKYPLNPSTAPVANYDEISQIQLFSDGMTPHQEGIALWAQ